MGDDRKQVAHMSNIITENECAKVTQGKLNAACPVILSVINKLAVKPLLDIGAQMSATSENLAMKLKKNTEIPELPAPTIIIKGALGEKTKVNRQIYLEMSINGEQISQVFLVIKELSNPLRYFFTAIAGRGAKGEGLYFNTDRDAYTEKK